MIRPTLIYGVASMLPALLSFILLPFYSKQLSTAEFGIIAAMGVLSSVLAVFANLALDRAAFRFYFDSDAEAARRRVLGTFFLGALGVAALCGAVLLLARPLLLLAYPDIPFYPYYVFTILTVCLSVCEGFVLGYFRVAEKPRLYLLMMFLVISLQGGLIYYFVMVRGEGALGQVRALLYTALVLLPVYLGVAVRQFSWRFDWQLFKQGVGFSWPFIPTLLIAWVLNWSDSVFLANYSTLAEVGLYSMAYKISMVFFILTSAFAVAYQPVFFRKANQADQSSARAQLAGIIFVASRAFIAAAFLLALFAEDVVRLLLDRQYHGIYPLIRVIVLSHIFAAIMGISSNLYYLQSKRSQLQLAVVSSSAVVNLALNFLLVPRFGSYGAAGATVLAMMALTVMHYQFAKSCYFINIGWLRLLGWISAAGAVVLVFQVAVEGTPWSFAAKLLLLAVLAALVWQHPASRLALREFRTQ